VAEFDEEVANPDAEVIFAQRGGDLFPGDRAQFLEHVQQSFAGKELAPHALCVTELLGADHPFLHQKRGYLSAGRGCCGYFRGAVHIFPVI
jgi:hypothetical protein